MSSDTARLHESVAAVCPIDGVSVGKPGDPSTVRIDFRPEATPERRAAAEAAVKAFDWSDAAQAQWEADRNVPAAAALLQSADPVAQGVRATVRAVVDLLNERLRGIGAAPILEPEILAALAAGFPAGISLPGPRRDV